MSKLLPEPERKRRHLLTRQQTWNPYPAFLYKYRTGNEIFLDRLIVHNELYFASRDQFNDPFDARCHMLYEGTGAQKRARFQKLMKDNHASLKQREALARVFFDPLEAAKHAQLSFDQVADRIGIYSFTENPRSLLMWAHYANEHKGICLQFYLPSDPAFVEVFPVRYSDNLLTVNWVTDTLKDEWAVQPFLTKSREWLYEEEWRAFERNRAGVSMTIRPQALVGVIYGARCEADTIDRVRGLIATRVEAGHPPLYEWQAKLSSKHFGTGIFTADGPLPRDWKGRPSTHVKSVAARSKDGRAP
ncbi:DUF2971 domain-containing protein [Paraburkholderia solisilvae]|nr:DUF2971 domain-containing protein [Paraburkholderia solisilvae]